MTVRKHWKTIVTVLLFAALTASLFASRSFWREALELMLSGNVEGLVAHIRGAGAWAPLVSILLMIAQSVAAPIPSFLITSANGLVFGVVWGTIISWIGAMLGAWICFLLARILGNTLFRKSEDHAILQKARQLSGEHGAFAVFTARLIPFISFDFISYAAGISGIPLWKFLAATGIGMIPGTIAYVLLGYGIGTGALDWKFIVLIAALAITASILLRKRKRKTPTQ